MNGDALHISIFSGSSGQAFTRRVCEYIGVEPAKSYCKQFSDGNIFVSAGETVRDKEVYLINPIGIRPNDEFVEILFWMDAFKRASASSVTAIIPYFGYAKGDKKDEPRVSIRARVCAECIELAGADRVVTMDLHSAQVQGFFKKPVDHLYAMPLLCETVKHELEDCLDNLVVVAPDAGFAKQARKYGALLKRPIAIGDKMRTGHDENAEVMELIGDVEGRDALIVDDFTISGGTIASLAAELKRKGARRVFACLAHNAVTDEGIRRISDSCIERVFTTDSVDNRRVAGNDTFHVISVAGLFAETIMRIHNHTSVSPLYERVPDGVFTASAIK